jgi:NAD-dependent protein deacetylase/lipoamidase
VDGVPLLIENLDSGIAPARALIEQARSLIGRAERLVVLTGAGVSAESGMPTFRGPGGMWKSFRPEDLATPEAFARDPRLVWEWYAWRRGLVAECRPNAAHIAIARLALARPGRTTIVTQNVDGLHHAAARIVAAGRDPMPAFPLEVHGAIHRDRCDRCARRVDDPAPVDSTSSGSLPRCTACDGPMRPDVVWFGETLDPDVIGASFEAAQEADVCLVVGTSALVYPAASIPDATAGAGGSVVEINLESTALTDGAEISLLGSAGALVPQVLEPVEKVASGEP